MKIVFFGCDDFAAVSLARLIEDGVEVLAVVTRPDRPRGRGLRLAFSPTKEMALARGIEVYQPSDLKDPSVLEKLGSFQADFFVVIAYGRILPQAVLILPRIYCVNVHASLLPAYRGAAPINWALINGETRTGVTLIKMDITMDGGDILAAEACDVSDEIPADRLRSQLADMGAELLSRTLPRIAAGEIILVCQDSACATYAPKMDKDLGLIRWDRPAKEIHNLVRGVQPWPGAATFWRGGMVKILQTSLTGVSVRAGRAGEITALHKDGFLVQASDVPILVRRVHPSSSKAMDARAFIAGYKLVPGDFLCSVV